MKVLANIKSEHIVSIDIETVRVADKFSDLSEGYQSAWRYKNKNNGVVPTEEELAEMWVKNSALYAEFSKVCAVSLTFLSKNDKLFCKEFYGVDEKAILNSLAVSLDNMSAKDSNYRLVGHSSKFFDYPFLGKRYLINNLQIPKTLDSSNSKPWEQMNLCTNELWKLGGTGAGSSLQALCNCLDIPISKVDLVGDEVGTAFYNGELKRIGRYCSLDTIATFNVIRHWKKESIFSFEEVSYIVEYSEDMKIEEKPEEEKVLPLTKLFNTKDFGEYIKDHLRSKKILKKDKDKVKELVLAHYLEIIDVVAMNKKELNEINEARTKEVEEFFKTLN